MTKDSSNGGTGPDRMRYALKTFGSSGPKRRHFDTIDEIEHNYNIQPNNNNDGDLYGAHANAGRNTVIERVDETAESDEEAIIRTRAFSVTYEYRSPQ